MNAPRNRGRARRLFAAASLLLCLTACSAEQMYDSSQGWRPNQCSKTLDKAEYDRCMAQADAPYGSYKTESEQKR